MPRYRATLTQRVYETATIEVEAASLEDAEELIDEVVDKGDVDWEFWETDERTVTNIEELDA